ncbi:MAG TPA: toxin-antitoxin system YwqK family antitoxin [Flavobacteriia bacterium]|nr:toxin-antitoxin system YwqK family antitoxin [Flavobacteriia bacterium]
MKKILFLLFIFSNILNSQAQVNQFDAKGKRHGIWKKQYPNGHLKYVGKFNHGKEIGTFKHYNINGSKQPIIIRKFEPNSDIALVTFYNLNGNKESEGKMKGKRKIGKWIYFHKDGKSIMVEENYVNGKLDGEYKTFYPDGKPTVIAHYKNDKLDGKYQRYSIKNKIYEDFTFKNGKRNGYAIFYNRLTGLKLEEGNYLNNKKVGLWKFYIDGEEANTIDMDAENAKLEKLKK